MLKPKQNFSQRKLPLGCIGSHPDLEPEPLVIHGCKQVINFAGVLMQPDDQTCVTAKVEENWRKLSIT